MNYSETVSYLFSMLPVYQRDGAAAYKENLDNTIALLAALDNPQQKLKCIHVAGTNGKGSVSHMIASSLQEAGYRCGLYISPHYQDYRERIKINGIYIEEDFVIAFVARMQTHIEKIAPSFFELTVAMAFDYFAQQNIDYAIIETGLGGRLDSTNVIHPLLSVITNISYDHMNLLGNTLELIAKEKAGIIKAAVPVIIGETQEEIRNVFINRAYASGSTIYFADKEVALHNYIVHDYAEATFDLAIHPSNSITQIHIDYASAYQQKNICTAAFALITLRQMGLQISDEHIRLGFEKLRTNTQFIGRWMIIDKEPLTIFDSAHNQAGIELLLKQMASLQYKKLHWVFGAVNDKDLSKIIAMLPKVNTCYYLCKPNIPRGQDVRVLNELFIQNGLQVVLCADVRDAFEMAQKNCEKDEAILVAGSIFVVAELL